MSDRLEEQLRDYGVFLDEEQGAVDVSALRERGALERVARPSRSPRSEPDDDWEDFDMSV